MFLESFITTDYHNIDGSYAVKPHLSKTNLQKQSYTYDIIEIKSNLIIKSSNAAEILKDLMSYFQSVLLFLFFLFLLFLFSSVILLVDSSCSSVSGVCLSGGLYY